jgi:hypothetical protein
MGVAGIGQDAGSEHTGRPAYYLADSGNPIGVDFVSSASIAMSERPTTGCSGRRCAPPLMLVVKPTLEA